jgi:hypothetical protein
MPASLADEVLADPIGVLVDLVAEADTGLGRDAIIAVVTGVAGGRAKRRRLAQAVLDKPSVLTDGRSPAPRAIAELLLALRKAGAAGISAPVCTDCDKPLRTFHRLGEHWYCWTCASRSQHRCASCGQQRTTATLDRHGQPRCAQCPDRDDRDPMLVLTAVIGTLEPTLPTDTIRAAVGRVFSKPGYQRRLAWTIEDRPALLTGQGAQAPMAGVLRLIDELHAAGAQTITRPSCPRCRRIVHLHRRIDGQWCCRNCVAKSRAQPCSRCGAIREAAARDEQGAPLCPNCMISDPANQETCIRCGRRRRVSVRSPDGPLCQTCRPVTTVTCSICGRSAPGVISTATGKPWCHACGRRRARCTGCGLVRLVRGGTLGEPLCATCTRPDPSFWHTCPGCGEHTAQRRRSCGRCTLRRRLQQLLRDDSGAIHPQLQALHDHLAHHERPESVLVWLNKRSASQTLAELATGTRALTHAGLDELPDSKPLRHLRSILVSIGALPARDEQLIRLEHWIDTIIAERLDADERQLLHRYALWHVLRRLRGRLHGAHTTYEQVVAARRNITAATALLDWLARRELTLATARQGDLEQWLTSGDKTHRADAGNFVRWTRKQKLTTLEFAAVRWRGPTGVIDTETRWEQARRLLHDDTLKPEDRVAGLLVLLYAQTAATISKLTLDHIQASDTEVRLRLGREPVALPEPVDTLVRQLVATRHGHATLGDQGTSPWLFPGGRPGQPISAARLAERLRQNGIHAGPSRSTALFQLATDLPAAVLSRILGIHIKVAADWQRASAGDWTNYAAEISRRPRP